MRDGAHAHHEHSAGTTFDQAGELVVIFAACVVGIDVLMWILHILIIIATAIGFLALGAGAGYAWIKIRQHRNRRHAWPLIQPSMPPNVIQPYCQPPAYPQLPAGGDIHLHLPPGVTADEVRDLMTRHAMPGDRRRE
jgi:hypothetical protein